MNSTEDNIEIAQLICDELDIELDFIQPYHLRISDGSKRLDYFPKSGRATWVSSQKWFKIEDIDKFLLTNFKTDL